MFDPHVNALYYKVSSDEGISYHEPESISFSNDLGTFYLSDGNLKIVPNEHFVSEDEAREAFVSFLKAWEIHSDLTSMIGMIRFKFHYSEIILLNLPANGLSGISVSNTLNLTCSPPSPLIVIGKYPSPPKFFDATDDVQIAYRRWLNYLRGKEPLPAMAYFVLTLLERSTSRETGARKVAKEVYQIDIAVFDKIADLSTNRGGENDARKIKSGQQFQEMSNLEQRWLNEAIRLVIHRLGEYASGAPLEFISLDKLPNLN